MVARSVNSWPGLAFDLGALGDRLSGLLAAGFYYKTFMGPPGDWNRYGPLLRRMAGLGVAPKHAGEQACEKRFHHCDLLVAGAGPAGLQAALAAARGGLRVLIADDGAVPGGTLRESHTEVDRRAGSDWVADVVAELDACPEVLRLDCATVSGCYDHHLLTVCEQHPEPAFLHERLWKVRARRVVFATGASERPLVFANNDRPGVMPASAALGYLRRYAVRPGQRAVAVTNNDSTYRIVAELIGAGLEIAALADLRERPPDDLVRAIEAHGVEVLRGQAVVDVRGARSVRAAEVAPPARPGERRRIACDLVLCSGGWNPRVQLHTQSAGRLRYDATLACFVPAEGSGAQCSAGASNGVFDLHTCLRRGWQGRSRGLPGTRPARAGGVHSGVRGGSAASGRGLLGGAVARPVAQGIRRSAE